MVHHAASHGYSTAADTYVRGRPGYPDETSQWLRDVVGLRAGRTVLEIGAGTGKFLPFVLGTGADVVALEPVAAMRAKIEVSFDLTVLDGSAEQIDLPDATVDAIVCAQSFHWFATTAALSEMRRVLRPGGVLGLIWNGRDTTVPWVADMGQIIDAHQGDAPRYQTGKWRDLFPVEGFNLLDERHARHVHRGRPDQVIIDRALSTSFIAALPAPARSDVEQKLRALIRATPELADRREIELPYDTLMIALRKDGA